MDYNASAFAVLFRHFGELPCLSSKVPAEFREIYLEGPGADALVAYYEDSKECMVLSLHLTETFSVPTPIELQLIPTEKASALVALIWVLPRPRMLGCRDLEPSFV